MKSCKTLLTCSPIVRPISSVSLRGTSGTSLTCQGWLDPFSRKRRLQAAVLLPLLLLGHSLPGATRTVTSLADSGPGSLRDTITASASGNGSDIGALEVDSLLGAISITKSNAVVRVIFKSDPGSTYTLQQANTPTDTWTNGANVAGTGRILELTDPAATVPTRFYRILAEP